MDPTEAVHAAGRGVRAVSAGEAHEDAMDGVDAGIPVLEHYAEAERAAIQAECN